MRAAVWVTVLVAGLAAAGCDGECEPCDECEEPTPCDECPEDADGDGFTAEQGDCDDADAAVHPLADEVCGDDVDSDCSGDPDDGATDADGDGHVDQACTGGTDCDDADAARHPDAGDVCDGDDNDCDGAVDEDSLVVDPNGTGDTTTIQAAIDLSSYGEHICVYPGTYEENLRLEGRNVTVASLAGPTVTTVDGGGVGTTVTHTFGDGSTLEGLSITGGAGTEFDPDHDGEPDLCGGGVFVDASDVTLIDVIVTGNAADDGAGLYVNNASLTLESSTIHDNAATRYGGGLRLRQTDDVLVSDTDVDQNTAATGGGLALYSSSMTMLDSSVEGNVVTGRGGAMYVGSSSSITLSSTVIASNEAESIGGGLRIYNAQAYLGGCQITDNTSLEDGGGIACKDSTMSVTGSSIEDNDPNDLLCDGCEGCEEP